MFQRIRAVVVALAMGAGALAMAPPATAAQGAQTPAIESVGVSPAPVEVTSGTPVPVTFSAVTSDDATKVIGWLKPKLGVETRFELSKSTDNAGAGKTKWTATRDIGRAHGAQKWTFGAVAVKGSEESAPKSTEFDVKQVYATRIVGFDADPDLVNKGATVTVSGRLQIDKGGWRGLVGEKVAITFRPKGGDTYRHVATIGTGRHGTFSVGLRVHETGWWRAEYDGAAQAHKTVSDTDRVDVRAPLKDTRIVDFAVPAKVVKGDAVTWRGHLQVDDRNRWRGLAGQKVLILFTTNKSNKWQHVATSWTDRHGRFSGDLQAKWSGWWKAVYEGGSGVKSTASGEKYVKVVNPTPPPPPEKVDSRLIKFNAYPEPVRFGRYLKFRGNLQIEDDFGWQGHRAKVGLYFKAKGTKKWKFVKTTWSTGSGKLYTRVKATKSGYWRFYFRGDGDSYKSYSKSDYVRIIKKAKR